MLSQFQGLDIDRFVPKLLMSMLFKIDVIQSDSQSPQPPCLKFVEFLAKNIHSHLVNFHNTKHFAFHSYLIRMFLFFNEENLQLPQMVLTAEVNNEFFKYINLLMSKVYKILFQNKFPRVLPQMQRALQFALDRKIWDWFLLEEHTIIRVYDFTHEPYILPPFLTPRFFALEFIRQKLIVENEHFISFKKASEIKFPWVVGPFIIEIKLHSL